VASAESQGPEETIDVPSPGEAELPLEDGIVAKSALLQQARSARSAIEKHAPDRILTIGGDCLVDLAPIAYLNKRYGGDVGVLWIDAHPDIQTLKDTGHAHAQVLGMLLGEGEATAISSARLISLFDRPRSCMRGWTSGLLMSRRSLIA
jgi:arginase